MQSVPYPSSQTQVRVNSFIRSVYNWMGIALALSIFFVFTALSLEPLVTTPAPGTEGSRSAA